MSRRFITQHFDELTNWLLTLICEIKDYRNVVFIRGSIAVRLAMTTRSYEYHGFIGFVFAPLFTVGTFFSLFALYVALYIDAYIRAATTAILIYTKEPWNLPQECTMFTKKYCIEIIHPGIAS